MRLTLSRKHFISLGVVLVIVFSAVFPAVLSGLSHAATPSPGQGLEISPPLVELKADPGQTLSTTIKLRNVTKNNLITSSSKEDFIAGDEAGNPKILLEEGETSPYSLKDWIADLPDSRIVPQQQRKFSVTINVPENASPGGHYGVIRFTAVPEDLTDTGVSLSASIGALILVRVSGDIKESARIEEFYITNKDDKRGSFFEYGPLKFFERINNTGNVHFKASGEVIVKNIFGKQVATLKVNETSRNVLPGSIRKFEQGLAKKRLFGRYKATLTLVYGESNQNISKTIAFWVIPYKLILLILLILVVLFITIRFGLKRYKKRVISKANNQR